MQESPDTYKHVELLVVLNEHWGENPVTVTD